MSFGVSLTQARAHAPLPGFAAAFRHGSLPAKLYRPRGHDGRSPHAQDEMYVVVTGSGTSLYSGERRPFAPGDVLLAPAGAEPRFEAFTDDPEVWAIFPGPDGGERPDRRTVLGGEVRE